MVNQPDDADYPNLTPDNVAADDDALPSNKPGLLATLLILLMIASILGTLFWPLIWQVMTYDSVPATPTPLFLQEASI